MKIVVLAGGISPERDVSLTSATMICNTLRDLGHSAIVVDIFFGHPGTAEELEALFDATGHLDPYQIPDIAPDLEALKKERAARLTGNENDPLLSDELGPNVLALCRMADICFMGLHGGIGENGKLQAMLDILGVKYTGTNSISSMLAMHKGVTKQIFVHSGIPAAKGFLLHAQDQGRPLSDFGLTPPVVVKVCSGGSSIGVYIPQTEEEYHESCAKCFEMEGDVLLEEYISGREFAVPVIDGEAYPVIEVIPKNGWFDYAHKYQSGQTDEICPAQIDDEAARKMQAAAVEACEALQIETYARADFLLDENGDIFCVEVNTLPGMTPASLLPKSAAVAGLSYNELCQKIIDISLKKSR